RGDAGEGGAEAGLLGAVPFCLTVDREAPAYLSSLFGPRGFAVLRTPEHLPAALIGVVRVSILASMLVIGRNRSGLDVGDWPQSSDVPIAHRLHRAAMSSGRNGLHGAALLLVHAEPAVFVGIRLPLFVRPVLVARPRPAFCVLPLGLALFARQVRARRRLDRLVRWRGILRFVRGRKLLL